MAFVAKRVLLILGTADIAVLDASDVYTAGLNYELVPFISEVYNLEDADYYVVAVAKESDPDTELTYLRSKRVLYKTLTNSQQKLFFQQRTLAMEE